MGIISLIIKESLLLRFATSLHRHDLFLVHFIWDRSFFVGYLSSMTDTKQIAIHDESGLFVKTLPLKTAKGPIFGFVCCRY
jgi:ABC-2 type transport system permease protein